MRYINLRFTYLLYLLTLGGLVLGSQNNVPDETNGINNVVSGYKGAVQFSVSFLMSLFASF